MSKIKSDIEIARKAKMKPIAKILSKMNVPDKSSAFSPMGRHIAKINFEFLDKLKKKKDGNLILVTAITPTPAGEGKTTTIANLAITYAEMKEKSKAKKLLDSIKISELKAEEKSLYELIQDKLK